MTDMQDIEQRLSRSSKAAPDGLRNRVLVSLRAESHRESRRARWTWMFGIAASIMIAMNVSLGAVERFQFADSSVAGPSEKTVGILQELLPDLSEKELRRQALLSSATVTPMADLTAAQNE